MAGRPVRRSDLRRRRRRPAQRRHHPQGATERGGRRVVLSLAQSRLRRRHSRKRESRLRFPEIKTDRIRHRRPLRRRGPARDVVGRHRLVEIPHRRRRIQRPPPYRLLLSARSRRDRGLCAPALARTVRPRLSHRADRHPVRRPHALLREGRVHVADVEQISRAAAVRRRGRELARGAAAAVLPRLRRGPAQVEPLGDVGARALSRPHRARRNAAARLAAARRILSRDLGGLSTRPGVEPDLVTGAARYRVAAPLLSFAEGRSRRDARHDPARPADDDAGSRSRSRLCRHRPHGPPGRTHRRPRCLHGDDHESRDRQRHRRDPARCRGKRRRRGGRRPWKP